MKNKEFCYDCGCKGSIPYKNVKNMIRSSSRWYTNVEMLFDLELQHFDVCGNIVLKSAECSLKMHLKF